MKKLSYVKLHETWCLYFPFLFSSSVMQSFFLFPASSLFGTQQQLTHPPIKSSILPTRKMPVFRGVVPWNTIFTSSCVNSLWDSATLERNIMVYHKKVSDYTTFTLMMTWSFLGTLILKQCYFKNFLWRRCTNELIDLWQMNRNFRILYSVYEIKNVPRFIANLRIGRISSNLKKKHVLSILS